MLKDVGMIPLRSTTTRQPRPGEINGVHYDFISKDEFIKIREKGEFVEDVTFGDNFYGLDRRVVNDVAAQNKPGVVVVEPYGRDQIVAFAKRHGWIVHTVFVDNPAKVIARRFLNRVCIDTYKAGMEGAEIMPIIEAHSKRLAIMLDKEASWRLEAYTLSYTSHPYKLLIHAFDESNALDVVARVCALIDASEWQNRIVA
jgi:hypothetical protein